MKMKALIALAIAAIGLSGCIVIEGGARNHHTTDDIRYTDAR